MNISLENWLRNKLQENEEMHDYAVATDTVRCWIDEYKQLSQPAVIKSVCDLYNERDNCTAFRFRKEYVCIDCMHNKQTVL